MKQLYNILRVHYRIYFFAITAALVVCLLFFGFCAPKNVILHTETRFCTINEDWNLLIDEKTTPLTQLSPYTYHATTATITRKLPQDTATQYLLFYTEHQEVHITIDDAMVYRYEIPDGFTFLKTPGCTWHTLAIAPEDAGKTIAITLTCPFSYFQTLPGNIFYLPQGQLQLAQAYSIWFCNTVALFMIILAVISCVSSSFWKSALLKRYTLRLGFIYGCIALWLFTEIDIATIVLRNDITNHLFSMLFIRLLPLCFYYFFETLSPSNTKWHIAVEWVFAANMFVPFLLQFALGISLLDTLPLHYLLAFCSTIFALCGIVWRGYKALTAHVTPPLYELLYMTNAILLCGILGEIYLYINQGTRPFLHGMSISIAVILFTIITRIILVRIEAQFEHETKTLALENNKLQRLPLMQQINAHFLFNTLNNISFLCKQNPKAADKAVLLLAQYMREYMFLINSSDLILFSRERSLMHAYLSIQQMRFQEQILFSITQNTPDFYLPPLCIQPFVENAISHGLRAKKGGGKITIDCTIQGEYIKITVQDNGVGFDLACLQQTNHIGIQNVQKRLGLYGGWASIQSTSSGTTVDIFMPQHAPSLQTPEI